MNLFIETTFPRAKILLELATKTTKVETLNCILLCVAFYYIAYSIYGYISVTFLRREVKLRILELIILTLKL